METPEQCVSSVQNWHKRHQNNVIDVILVSLLLTLNKFQAGSNVSIVDFEQVNASRVLLNFL